MTAQHNPRSPRRSALWSLQLSSKLARSALAIVALALGTAGCTKTPVKPPKSPLMEARKDERIEHDLQEDLERRHLAPPPAYGNKVVMAKDAHGKTESF